MEYNAQINTLHDYNMKSMSGPEMDNHAKRLTREWQIRVRLPHRRKSRNLCLCMYFSSNLCMDFCSFIFTNKSSTHSLFASVHCSAISPQWFRRIRTDRPQDTDKYFSRQGLLLALLTILIDDSLFLLQVHPSRYWWPHTNISMSSLRGNHDFMRIVFQDYFSVWEREKDHSLGLSPISNKKLKIRSNLYFQYIDLLVFSWACRFRFRGKVRESGRGEESLNDRPRDVESGHEENTVDDKPLERRNYLEWNVSRSCMLGFNYKYWLLIYSNSISQIWNKT